MTSMKTKGLKKSSKFTTFFLIPTIATIKLAILNGKKINTTRFTYFMHYYVLKNSSRTSLRKHHGGQEVETGDYTPPPQQHTVLGDL